MKASVRRLSAAFVLLLTANLLTLAGGGPAFAAPPCYASSCDSRTPFDPAITSGCGTFVPYHEWGTSDTAVISIRYSQTCHAAYVEMIHTPTANEVSALLPLFESGTGSPAFVLATIAVSSSNTSSAMVSWDNSIKGCFVTNAFGVITDPDPLGKDVESSKGFCSKWT